MRTLALTIMTLFFCNSFALSQELLSEAEKDYARRLGEKWCVLSEDEKHSVEYSYSLIEKEIPQYVKESYRLRPFTDIVTNTAIDCVFIKRLDAIIEKYQPEKK